MKGTNSQDIAKKLCSQGPSRKKDHHQSNMVMEMQALREKNTALKSLLDSVLAFPPLLELFFIDLFIAVIRPLHSFGTFDDVRLILSAFKRAGQVGKRDE